MARGFLGLQNGEDSDVKEQRGGGGTSPDAVISIIGPGMKLGGDCDTDGTIRIDGHVEGTVRAGKAVIVGKDGVIDGDVHTQDAVVSGRVNGTLTAQSRLELQATCRIEGEVFARRMQLEEGAILNGTLHMGEDAVRDAEVPGESLSGVRSSSPGSGPEMPVRSEERSSRKKEERATAGA